MLASVYASVALLAAAAGCLPAAHALQGNGGVAFSLDTMVQLPPIVYETTADQFIREHLFIQNGSYNLEHFYRCDITRIWHFYFKQAANLIDVNNGDIVVSTNDNGRIISFSNSFANVEDIPPRLPGSSWETSHPEGVLNALAKFAKYAGISTDDFSSIQVVPVSHKIMELANVPFTLQPVRAEQTYLQLSDGSVVQTWLFRILLRHHDYHVHVHALDGRVLQVVDWVSQGAYRALPLSVNNPTEGERQLLVNPESQLASPSGWVKNDWTAPPTTRGNNVEVYADSLKESGGVISSPMVEDSLTFDYALDVRKSLDENLDAVLTNLFVTLNAMHDLLYGYGFTEIAGNFQSSNYDREGLGDDDVVAVVVSGARYDGADFFATSEGESPRIFIYRRDEDNVDGHGALNNGLIVHEYTHGLTSRLVGGPWTGHCLNAFESAGINEGIADFVAVWTEIGAHHTRIDQFDFGRFSGGKTARTYPYTTDMNVNPTTFAFLNDESWAESHKQGEIWASMLLEVYWNLVGKLGFGANMRSASSKHGNTLMLKLLMVAMKMTPCQATFIMMRDMLLQAERRLTHGAHQCDIWRGFAKRGLGIAAKSSRAHGTGQVVEDTSMPAFCTVQR
ncbi:Fungalysin metallopeptidase-domain-containing protein [Thamnocephalis sphaerospora]|uniref:Extracellular metalloproteinase n=1 Tax=Thamnocephalis sphaerospora TaxID=78915 RepID=A0A4P9XU92_9FUNG|nr:Fungalysin metallopeptidase-domain-containing protein [Thamnocephalis sphaerospora]|eukprot:RKP09766.1 Fungalysin metallopeptidase-domain-containing protein [Thamnocephalis sphaerospora]